ncbi:hypothetical protein, partial [Thiolapillus sp.]|uniref:hypothetical protein n=1 Tax=Thiolapillus sp. TaxID=2017437 RepID=UPI003AF4E192
MTRTAGAPMGCQRPSRFWGLGCPKIYHEAEDTLAQFRLQFCGTAEEWLDRPEQGSGRSGGHRHASREEGNHVF